MNGKKIGNVRSCICSKLSNAKPCLTLTFFEIVTSHLFFNILKSTSIVQILSTDRRGVGYGFFGRGRNHPANQEYLPTQAFLSSFDEPNSYSRASKAIRELISDSESIIALTCKVKLEDKVEHNHSVREKKTEELTLHTF